MQPYHSIVVLTVLDERKRRQLTSLSWHEQRSICLLKRTHPIPWHIVIIISSSSHKPRQQQLRLLFMYACCYRPRLYVVEYNSLFPFLFDIPPSVKHSTHIYTHTYIYIRVCIDWTLLVPSTRKWRRAHAYVRIFSFDKYCTMINLFLADYIMDKLYWWTYTYIAGVSLAKTNIRNRGHN